MNPKEPHDKSIFNQIKILDTHAFSNMPKLKRLILLENIIDDLMENAFEGLYDLELLIIDKNLLQVLSVNVFLRNLSFLKIEC